MHSQQKKCWASSSFSLDGNGQGSSHGGTADKADRDVAAVSAGSDDGGGGGLGGLV